METEITAMQWATWDREIRSIVERSHGDAAERFFERNYPLSTVEVVNQCHLRGVKASQARVEAFAKLPTTDLRIIGKQRCWYRDDINTLVNYLEAEHSYTLPAMNARVQGLTLVAHISNAWERVVWCRVACHEIKRESCYWIPITVEHIRAITEVLARPDLSNFYTGDEKTREILTAELRGLLCSLVRADRDLDIPLPMHIREQVYARCRELLDGKLPGALPAHKKNKGSK